MIGKIYVGCLLGGLMCIFVGIIQKLINTGWVWNPLYYGILLFILGILILIGYCIYDLYSGDNNFIEIFYEDEKEDDNKNK